ncbi:MAG: DUF433 domain-containing protein [Patescibacteria group bacterium]
MVALFGNEVVADPAILGGKPVIKGTRIPVVLVVDELSAGTSQEEIMQEYDLTREQIQAALRYASAALREEIVIPV